MRRKFVRLLLYTRLVRSVLPGRGPWP